MVYIYLVGKVSNVRADPLKNVGVRWFEISLLSGPMGWRVQTLNPGQSTNQQLMVSKLHVNISDLPNYLKYFIYSCFIFIFIMEYYGSY